MQIKIGHLTYDVIEVAKEHMDDAHRYGDCNHDKQRIRLSDDMSQERYNEVLLHEIIHAVFNAQNIQSENEEVIVTSLANGLSAVLTEYPDLFKPIEVITHATT